MNNMLTRYFTLSMIILLMGCDELVRTQNKRLHLELTKDGIALTEPFELNADGTSLIALTAKSDREFGPEQSIKFTTTNGSLHSLNDTEFTSENKTLEVKPLSRAATVFLRSSVIPNQDVLVAVTVNNLTTLKKISFTQSCADELLMSLDDAEVSLSDGESVALTISLLRDDHHNASDNIRLDLTSDNDELIQYSKTAFSENGQVIFEIKPKAEGEVVLTASVNTQTCAALTEEVVLKIEE